MEPFALWTAADAAAATSGHNTADWVASGVAIDSRAVAQGDFFIALQGPRFDGHDFVAAALAAGAVAAMVARRPAELPTGAPLLQVEDTLVGLGRLGAVARQRVGARIIAVTGSVGKTGTKEALQLCLSEQGPTHASAGSFNNQWGVPLSLARMPPDTSYGVFEIGMNHAGEITPLVGLARPHVAIVTTVEAVHSEHFANLRAIADAKAEIFAGVEPGGSAVINRDNPQFAYLAERARALGIAHIIAFGSHPEATTRLINFALHPSCSTVTADIEGETIAYKIGAPGRHWVMNSLAVLATVKAVRGDLALASAALAGLTPPQGRGRRAQIEVRGGSFELIDDSYNASPVSMRAGIEILAGIDPGPRGRRIAVLGDMLELGPQAADLHAALAADLAAAPIDSVFAAGPLMRRLYDALPPTRQGAHAANSTDLLGVLKNEVRAGDVVLVKGSYGSRMGVIVDGLRGVGGAPKRAASF